MFQGCFTALVTPFAANALDTRGLEQLLDFQLSSGVAGLLAAGTTGESPTLSWEEHNQVTEIVARTSARRVMCIAGTGSNNTQETLAGTRHAAESGAQAVLLVDPYYNGPSSLEIRREYVAPVAKAFPDIQVIPYIIPGRTGTQMLPEDVAILAREFANVSAVKEATGNVENMRRTRACCQDTIAILSGDDDMTLSMVQDPLIRASGVISVTSNIAPKAVSEMMRLALAGQMEKAREIETALRPLFQVITVKTQEDTPYGPVTCRARNPLATKTLMRILGMPSGESRPPMGKMTRKGLEKVLEAGRTVWQNNPEILTPVAQCFGVNIEQRLYDESLLADFAYGSYC